jgi:integrase
MAGCGYIPNKHTFNKIMRLAKEVHEKYYIMGLIATNLGFRAEDVVDIKKNMIWDGLHVRFNIAEKKTGIIREFDRKIIRDIESIIEKYIEQFDDDDYIFPSSRKGKIIKNKHISYSRVYQVFHPIFVTVKIYGDRGLHVFRKTFAERSSKKNKNLKQVQDDLGHKHFSSTEKYLGLKKVSYVGTWI